MAVIDWNGREVPEVLRRRPAGRCVVEPLDDSPSLSADEEEGLIHALESLRAAHTSDLSKGPFRAAASPLPAPNSTPTPRPG